MSQKSDLRAMQPLISMGLLPVCALLDIPHRLIDWQLVLRMRACVCLCPPLLPSSELATNGNLHPNDCNGDGRGGEATFQKLLI